ncbi:hypothetical protein [Pseudomonas huaxiensis]|uniref:hypothetical protein n=1 Tax=Pseudomonas huaxiensis TaxID=2213017 RepID=UPI001300B289|nr:hypothetical protein [Pseudomonas huaxiensis]
MTAEAIKLYQAALQRLLSSQTISSGIKISCDNLAKAARRKKTPFRIDNDLPPLSVSNHQALRNQTTKDDLNS